MHEAAVILLPALAMGLGWGIRGQFGHETGAMVPGALVGLALAAVSHRQPEVAVALRLGAVGMLACSLGGVMTYGQTIGLVQGEGRARTWKWGLLGLAVKGAVWIGLTGAFLGMAASGQAYTSLEIGLLCVGLTALAAIGVRVLNRPHQPPEHLPAIYFSKRDDPRPRPEYWGGLWLALAGVLAYLMVRGDRVAVGLALVGLVGGGLGFPVGECLQAWGMHRAPFGARVQRWMDWWKVMEVSFGLLAGAALGFGWLLLCADIDPVVRPSWGSWWPLEVVLLAVWTLWLVAAETGPDAGKTMWEASFVALIIPMQLAFGGGLTCPFLVGPLLLWVSGDNAVQQWAHRAGLVRPSRAWAALGIFSLAFCGLTWLWLQQGAGAVDWLLLVAWAQTALTIIWALGSREVLAQGWRRPRFLASREQVAVQAVFIVMAALIAALAWGLPR